MISHHLSERVTTSLLLIGITFVLSVTGALQRIDNVLYDTGQQHSPLTPPNDVVLVTIDEQSLATLGRWPWSRRSHAQLIERLHADGALVIGMDILFAEPQSDDPVADALLAEAVARAGNVVLPIVIEKVRNNGQLIETLPLPELTAHAAALGRVHAVLDADTIARSIYLWEGLGQPVWPHFAQAMLTVANTTIAETATNAAPNTSQGITELIQREQRFINFATAHQQLPSLSYVQVVRGQFSPGTFKGKLVLVGATASGMADSLPTPVSGFKQPMPGVEFLANALISIRSQTLINHAPLWVSTAVACGLALLPMAWLPYVRTRSGLIVSFVYGVLVVLVAIALPLVGHIWVPMSTALVGLFSAYPLWAWRKLETANQFLDTELQRLQLQLGEYHSNQSQTTTTVPKVWVDPFQRRIEQVRAATTQLQQLEETQRETLAFVSHDIRVPLASAAMQIRQELGAQHPAHLQLQRALRWTEDFLQTARAQMLNRENFAELDITALLHEAVDEIYPLAQKQQLLLEISLPEDPQWVQGNAETLLRAVINLLGNALKFSPSGGRIGLQARIESKQIFIDVTDQGPGIAPEAKASLFKRFSRPQGDGVHTGAGLGLYFVHTVAHHHGGTVKYSRLPSRTCFCISLPLSQQETKNLNISQF